jgi:hypothetical protein
MLITVQLKRDGAAMREVWPGMEHRQPRDVNHRAEHSHQPMHQREGRM